MTDFYEELNLDRSKGIAEINGELSKLESTWKRREINNPEKATKMLAMIIDARKVFASDAARQAYDNDLQNSKNQPDASDPDKERASELSKWKSKAALYVIEKQYDVAKVAIEKALSVANGVDDDSLFAMAADIYQRCGNLNIALDHINKAIVLAPKASYFNTKGLIYDRMALQALQRVEYTSAVSIRGESRETFQRAVMAAENEGDLKNKAIACGALAYSYYFHDPIDKAEGERYANMAADAGGDSWGNADKVLQELNAIREEENKKAYFEAKGMAASKDIFVLDNAIEQFKKLGDYKDSRDQIRNIEQTKQKLIAEKEAQKKAQKEREIKRRKTMKMLFLIGAPVVVAAVLIGLLVANIQHHKCGEHLKWKISGTTMTISGTGPMEDYWDCDEKLKVDTLIIEDGCTSIGRSAFYYCSNLTSVSIPDSVTLIDSGAFEGCENLTQIELPSGLKELRYRAFGGTGLTSLHIPASVESFDFSDPPSHIEEITVDEDNPYFCAVDGALYDHDLKTLLGYPVGNPNDSFEIPDGVTKINIASGLWDSENLTSITFPQSVSDCDAEYVFAPYNTECVIHYPGTREQWMSNPCSNYIDCPVECLDGVSTIEALMAGIWYGDGGSMLTLREDMTCSYVDGYGASGDGTWDVVDNYLRVNTSAFSYELYGQLENGYSSATVCLEADDSSWVDEVFSHSDEETAVDDAPDEAAVEEEPAAEESALSKSELAGTWYGEAGGILTLREDLTCSYVDGGLYAQTGDGTWDVVDNYLKVDTTAISFELYGYLEDGYSSTSVCLQADVFGWNDEVFTRSEDDTASGENIDTVAETREILTVTADQADIRSGPDAEQESLGTVERGAQLTAVGKTDGWYQVEYNDAEAYIMEDCAAVGTDVFPITEDSGTFSVTGGDVDVRSGPGIGSESIGVVSAGTELSITGKNENWYQVDYDGQTGYVPEENGTKTYSVPITELSGLTRDPRTTDKLTDGYGNSYEFAITNNAGYSGSAGPLQYDYSNSEYDHFSATVYIPSGETSKGTSTLAIKGDGFILYMSPAMDKTSQPIDIDVNISGLSTITVEWSNNSGYSNISDLECCLANAYFSAGGSDEAPADRSTLPIALTDLDSVHSQVHTNTRLTDNFGNTYSAAVYNRVDNGHSNNIPIFEYHLDSKYSRFECTLYVPAGSDFTSAVSMEVIADGNSVYTSPQMTAASEPVDVSIDLTGCNDLQITFSERSWNNKSNDETLCLGNACVYMSEQP